MMSSEDLPPPDPLLEEHQHEHHQQHEEQHHQHHEHEHEHGHEHEHEHGHEHEHQHHEHQHEQHHEHQHQHVNDAVLEPPTSKRLRLEEPESVSEVVHHSVDSDVIPRPPQQQESQDIISPVSNVASTLDPSDLDSSNLSDTSGEMHHQPPALEVLAMRELELTTNERAGLAWLAKKKTAWTLDELTLYYKVLKVNGCDYGKLQKALNGAKTRDQIVKFYNNFTRRGGPPMEDFVAEFQG